ncbi:MAG: hypothetical protein RL123_101, partial [Pseudomonadota bacterium]
MMNTTRQGGAPRRLGIAALLAAAFLSGAGAPAPAADLPQAPLDA